MLALIQPFGLHSQGGGPRILRALLQDAPEPFLSIATGVRPPPPTTMGREIFLPSRPFLGRIESTRFAKYLWNLSPLVKNRFMDDLARILQENDVRAVHAIPHGTEFWYALLVAQRLGLPYYLNVHDELTYNLAGWGNLSEAMRGLEQAWVRAAGRMVISPEMGEEYCRRYGRLPYEVVTDGLTTIPDQPRPRHANHLRVYFGGALHLTYAPNFDALVRALSILQKRRPTDTISLTIRGSSIDPKGTTVPIHILPWGSEKDVAADLDKADLLYLPLPFAKQHESFYRYSLSTKLITYLGSGVPILYHGPEDAAAGRLLARNRAAVEIYSLDPAVIAGALDAAAIGTIELAQNALDLGRRQFTLAQQRERFWRTVRLPLPAGEISRGLANTARVGG